MSEERTVSDVVAVMVRRARKERGWNAADLAAHTNGQMSASVIQNIEHGRTHNGVRTRTSTTEELVVLADALGVPPAALMPGLDTSHEHGIAEAARIIDKAISQLEDLKAWYVPAGSIAGNEQECAG